MTVLLVLVTLLGSVSLAFGQSAGETPDQTVSIQGRVLADDANGTPLAGARVSVLSQGREAAFATSDRGGLFQVVVPATGDRSLRVTKAGYAPAEPPAAEFSRTPTIRLPRGAAITGRIVNQYGEPAAGVPVLVIACPEDCDGASPLSNPPTLSAAQTDDRGEYRIGSLAAGWYEIRIAANASEASIRFGDIVDLEAFRRRASAARAAVQRMRPNGRPADPDAVVRLRAGEETALHFTYEESQTGSAAAVAVARTLLQAAQERESRATGVVRGRVLGPTGRPLTGGSIRLLSYDYDDGLRHTTTTDTEGRYELRGLPAGSYRLRVSVPGHAPVEYGQRRALQQGTTIVLREGQSLDGIDLRLPPGGVIAGRVTDEYGEPLEGLVVQTLEGRFQGGRLALAAVPGVSSSRTDDRGEYRIFGLLPGTFYVTASEPVSGSGTPRVAPDGSVFLTTIPVEARGDGLSLVSMLNLNDGGPVYAPGSRWPGDARPVRVEPNGDAHGIDITFAHEPGVRVSGQVIDPTGGSLLGAVSLRVSRRSGAPAPVARTVSLGPDGRFEFTNVPPGDYVVRAAAGARAEWLTGDSRGQIQRAVSVTAERVGLAFATVTRDADVALAIRTSAGSAISGRLIIEGDAPPEWGFRLEAVPADDDRAEWFGVPRQPVSTDGRFALSGLIGPMRLRLAHAPPDWYLKSATIAGVDAAVYPVTIEEHPGAEVLAVVARGGEIAGRAVNDRGEPARDYSIVVFSTDPARWWEHSPYLRLARSIGEGSFSIGGVPSGDYWVAAVEQIEGDAQWGEWQDPDLLNRLIAQAQRVQVGDAQQATTELRVTRLIR